MRERIDVWLKTFNMFEQLEQKIDFFITTAQKQGEEGNIEESEAIMVAVEKLRERASPAMRLELPLVL